MHNQEFSSKNTSVNSRNLPTAFRKFGVGKNEVVLDYGCGKFYDRAAKFCFDRGASLYLPYDKYNCTSNMNNITAEYMEKYGVDRVFCCNVLNVIKEDNVIQYIVDDCLSNLRSCGMAVFQIYSGNNSGVGAPSKNDCYQRNCKAQSYAHFFDKYSILDGWYVRVTSVYITVNRDIPF